MHQLTLRKPDGRELRLYSRRALSPDIQATSPRDERAEIQPHLRWHPLRGEWVAYASHRQDRTFLPPKHYNPLAVTRTTEFPTELPAGDYEVAVFENLFPSLCLEASFAPELLIPTRPGGGRCEVVVFTQDPEASLGQLPLDRLELILEVWAERYRDLGAREDIQYVMPFENRGVEVGVTLHHPHGQLYAYPFVPPIPARELEAQARYFEKHGRGMMQDLIRDELKDGRRVLYVGEEAVAFVPAFARYPYEVWVAPRRAVPALPGLTPSERRDVARALKMVLLKFDGLWNRPFPYLMVLHQAPTDGKTHPEAHLHFEFYPPYRTQDKLKYLAGTELGAGMFANDSLPEEKAEELRAVPVTL